MNEDPLCIGGFYELLASIDQPADQLTMSYRNGRRASWSDGWEQARLACIAERAAAGRPLDTDASGTLPKLHRLDSLRVDGGRIELETSATDYAEYLVTHGPDWRDLPIDVRSQAIGVSALAVTTDRAFLVGRRSQRVTHSGMLHVLPSGHGHPPESLARGILGELHEELGLGAELVTSCRTTGVIRSLDNGKPEVTFLMELAVNSAAALEARSNANERWEFDEAWSVPWDADETARWIVTEGRQMVPPGHAAVLLGGRVRFGNDWMTAVVDEITALR